MLFDYKSFKAKLKDPFEGFDEKADHNAKVALEEAERLQDAHEQLAVRLREAQEKATAADASVSSIHAKVAHLKSEIQEALIMDDPDTAASARRQIKELQEKKLPEAEKELERAREELASAQYSPRRADTELHDALTSVAHHLPKDGPAARPGERRQIEALADVVHDRLREYRLQDARNRSRNV